MYADLTSVKYDSLVADSLRTVFVLPVFHLEASELGSSLASCLSLRARVREHQI